MESPKNTMIKVIPKQKEIKKKEEESGEMENQAIVPLSAELLIREAIQKGVDVGTMERLLAMRKELKAEFAKEAFDKDMAELQSEMPAIAKTKGVPTKSGQVAYKYTPIQEIVEKAKVVIARHGFSYMIKTEMFKNDQGLVTSVKSTCVVKHKIGHSEASEMEVPLGNKTEIMSASQVVAAASTFSKRYAFCNAFGIMTGDVDNDGAGGKETGMDQEDRIKKTMDMISNVTDVKVAGEFKEKIFKSDKLSEGAKSMLIAVLDDKIEKLKEKV